uniref:Uncharacterized protein n=1 Tax=Romanomermis culicivorax TaxID=13658 RepID=A0A915KAT6_ROMCU
MNYCTTYEGWSLLRHLSFYFRLKTNTIIPFVDSIGLNDQELLVLANVGDGPFANTSQGDILEPHKTVFVLCGQCSRLQRIHVHANGYHILAVSGDSWTNNRAALSAGARLGGKRACGEMIGYLETDTVELRLQKRHFLLDQDIDEFYMLNPRQPVYDWSTVFRPKGHSEWSEIYFFFTPLLMCRKPRNTASLGDIITSSALMFSEFHGFET